MTFHEKLAVTGIQSTEIIGWSTECFEKIVRGKKYGGKKYEYIVSQC